MIRSMTRARVATAAPPEREQSFRSGGGSTGGLCWVRSVQSWARAPRSTIRGLIARL